MAGIYPIDEDKGYEVIEDMGLDYYDVLDQAEVLFERSGVNLAPYEEPYAAYISSTVLGAIFAGGYGDEFGTVRFSVAVSPQARRKGVGRKLVKHLIKEARAQGVSRLEAWVINPHMALLLEDLDFVGDWSQDSPHMELWL